MARKVLIYHTKIPENASPDDKDVLDEAKFAFGILKSMGYEVVQMPFDYKNKKEIKNCCFHWSAQAL